MTKHMPGDEEATTEVLVGRRNPRNATGQSWLRHSGGSGEIDIALMKGATAFELESLRNTWRMHLYHLKVIHNLVIESTAEDDTGTKRYFLKSNDEYQNIRHDIDEIEDSNRTETTKEQLIDARVGQGRFRQDMFSIWGKCAVTGLVNRLLLRASHIKPWRASNDIERLDPFNGFLLSPSYDAAFDKGFVSFDSDGQILVSDSLSDDEVSRLGISRDASISLKKDNAKYLEYHRNEEFRK